ncbi:hypothetical protein [Acinetobacter sp. CE-15]|uniref:hypothetical protein n=1 Tax=Acinetobacter sp. CE-15 TaxID=3425693 RepID=UPI003DA3D3F2
MKLIKILIITVCLIGGNGCNYKAFKNEMAVKHQYSVMQAIESRYKNIQNTSQSYVLLKNALDSDTNLLLLPISDQDRGYVVFILNPYFGEDKVVIKYIPEDKKFLLKKETLNLIQKQIEIEENIEKFLTENSS